MLMLLVRGEQDDQLTLAMLLSPKFLTFTQTLSKHMCVKLSVAQGFSSQNE
uniref:Uncharacterized protein n=1 Tax=Peronospora matthiolae TaxID=2874970 RepID=A0AAV1UL19_9STRA